MLKANNEKLSKLLENIFSDPNTEFKLDLSDNSFENLDMSDSNSDNLIVDDLDENVKISQSIKPNSLEGVNEPGNTEDSTPLADPNDATESIAATADITESWGNGYKVEVDFDIPDSNGSWSIDLSGVDGTVREIHGLDIIEQNGSTLIVEPNSGYQSADYTGSSGNGVIIVDGTPPGSISVMDTITDSITTDNVIPASENTVNTVETTQETLGMPMGMPMGDVIDLGDSDLMPSAQTGKFNYGEALQKSLLYFDANESGNISDDNKFEWRGDATKGVNQGELSQGIHDTYFDAGDHVMFGQPLGYSNFALGLGVNNYRQAYQESGQLDEALKVIKRMSDGIVAGHEMEGGKTKSFVAQIGYGGGGEKGSHQFWNPPEEEGSSREVSRIYEGQAGTEVAANYAAGLAQAAIAFRPIDSAYADNLLDNAKALFSHAETYQGKYSDTIPQASPFYKSHSGFADELAAAAGSMYQATGEQSYLDKAENVYNNNGVGYTDFAPSADNASTLATLILAQESDNPKYQQDFENWADLWVEGKGAVQHSPGGQAFRQPWGSAVLSASASFAIETYADTVRDPGGYSDFATGQIDYILGDNPRNSSYVVGFGDNSPQRAHHRGAAGTQSGDGSSTPNDNILFGALVGGPSAADDFSYNDVRNDWITNEVGISYNAGLSGALVQQYDNLGGDPLSDQELDDLVGVSVEF